MSSCGAGDPHPLGLNERMSREAVGGDRRPPDVNYVFGNDVAAPRQARVAVQSLLDDFGGPIVWEVTVAVSELVTNVVTHTEQGGEMRVWDFKPGTPLRLEVHDLYPTMPTGPAQRSIGGRGLRVVDSVANDWGVTFTLTGKYVWAEFNRPVD